MVDEIYEYIPILHGNYTLCYFMFDCRILKQKNPSEVSDVSSSKKREQQIHQQHNASCCQVTEVFFVKRLESQGNNMLKTVKCMTKTAENSVKEATKRKDQHILLKGARY